MSEESASVRGSLDDVKREATVRGSERVLASRRDKRRDLRTHKEVHVLLAARKS